MAKRDLVLNTPSGRPLKAALYTPDEPPKALIVMVHGGGWRVGSIQGIAAYGEVFAGLGYAALAAEYRLLGEAPWPAQLGDVKLAVEWAADNAASLNLPDSRIALLGFSAGGHLALLAADDLKRRVGAVIALFPPTELVVGPAGPGQTPADKLLANPDQALAQLASPLHRAGPDFPPTFLIHGAQDTIVPPVTSQRMYDALVAAGVKAELHLYAGHTHEFADAPYMMELMAAEVANFLYRQVVDPAGARQQDLEHNAFARREEAR